MEKMYLLTGRAKNDFISWYGTGEHYFTTTLKPIEHYANIVEWLDTKEIYITIQIGNLYFSRKFFFSIHNEDIGLFSTGTDHETRQQATEAAIKLANQIYNNR